ncbi:hypothetical protein BGX38DRAFT_1142931 [Terfezia claveryi]|nr:hypothetical protein BGX38DRAFT_1142931 [Terfezia claveryi]
MCDENAVHSPGSERYDSSREDFEDAEKDSGDMVDAGSEAVEDEEEDGEDNSEDSDSEDADLEDEEGSDGQSEDGDSEDELNMGTSRITEGHDSEGILVGVRLLSTEPGGRQRPKQLGMQDVVLSTTHITPYNVVERNGNSYQANERRAPGW